jgi:hypothetical protein
MGSNPIPPLRGLSEVGDDPDRPGRTRWTSFAQIKAQCGVKCRAPSGRTPSVRWGSRDFWNASSPIAGQLTIPFPVGTKPPKRVFAMKRATSRWKLIHSTTARVLFLSAERALTGGDWALCAVECKKAYATLVTECSPFDAPPDDMGFWDAWQKDSTRLPVALRAVGRHMLLSLAVLRDDVNALAAGVHPYRLRRFESLTPSVALSANGRWHVASREAAATFTEADARFCLDFVLEAARSFEARKIPGSGPRARTPCGRRRGAVTSGLAWPGFLNAIRAGSRGHSRAGGFDPMVRRSRVATWVR